MCAWIINNVLLYFSVIDVLFVHNFIQNCSMRKQCGSDQVRILSVGVKA